MEKSPEAAGGATPKVPSLNVVIMGAGIAGLAAAIALRRAGHKVSMHEQRPAETESALGLVIPPNAGRLLQALGVDPIALGFVEARELQFYCAETLMKGSCMSLSAKEGESFGSVFYFGHRRDLHTALVNLATQADGVGEPVVIRYDSQVWEYDENIPSVDLSDGTTEEAQLVVAADGVAAGYEGGLESILEGEKSSTPHVVGNVCACFLIDADDIEADSDSRWFNNRAGYYGDSSTSSNGMLRIFTSYAGDQIATFPCRDGKVWGFIFMRKIPTMDFEEKVPLEKPFPLEKADMMGACSDYHRALLAVLAKATKIQGWPLMSRKATPRFFQKCGVVIGDAAHPVLPHHGQGIAMGIEDGVVLGIALCGVVGSPEERLGLFQTMRRPLVDIIQLMDKISVVDESSRADHNLVEFSEKLSPFVDEEPDDPRDLAAVFWGYDHVRNAMEIMRAASPGFVLPAGFFVGDSYKTWQER